MNPDFEHGYFTACDTLDGMAKAARDKGLDTHANALADASSIMRERCDVFFNKAAREAAGAKANPFTVIQGGKG